MMHQKVWISAENGLWSLIVTMENKPIYIRIIEDIKQKIMLGIYERNSPLPSENELSKKYSVNRVTVQKSISVLIAEDYIYSVPGKGIFAKEFSLNKYKYQYEELKKLNIKLIGVDIIKPPPEVIYNLQIPPDKYVIKIRRLAIDDEQKAIAYDIKYIPYYSGIQLIELELNNAYFTDLVSALASPYEIRGKIDIKGAFSDNQVSKALDISENTPVIEVSQKLVNEDNICIGWGIVYFNIDYFSLHAESYR